MCAQIISSYILTHLVPRFAIFENHPRLTSISSNGELGIWVLCALSRNAFGDLNHVFPNGIVKACNSETHQWS